MACVHDPRSGQVWHVDANGVVKGYTASAAAVGRWRQGVGDGFPNQ